MRERDEELHVNIPAGRILRFLVCFVGCFLHCCLQSPSPAPLQGSAGTAAKAGQKTDLNLITTPAGTGTYTVRRTGHAAQQEIIPVQGDGAAGLRRTGSAAIPCQRGGTTGHHSCAHHVLGVQRGGRFHVPHAIHTFFWQVGNDMYFALLTRPDTGIQSIEALRGKRVTYEYPAPRCSRGSASFTFRPVGWIPRRT